MEWRVLIVDDKDAKDVADVIWGQKVVSAPDSIVCILCDKFLEAMGLLARERFDLVILDLKDDAARDDGTYAGETVFEEIKKCRFVPVIFHTGFPLKVKDLVSPYVKVVARSEWSLLRSTIKEIFDTKLPKLVRHIEEEQRKFMWESAGTIWANGIGQKGTYDLVFVLARRIANSLSRDVVRSFLEEDGCREVPRPDTIHAVELYIYPPISKHLLFGDIFKKDIEGKVHYFIALTPSCDHAQKKADFVLISKCKYLAETAHGINAKTSIKARNPISSTTASSLKDWIRDKSSPADRYKFLPGTNFIPDLYVDFQDTLTVESGSLETTGGTYTRVASLDSPFAESLQAKMIRYFGRIGTPDIDSDLALERFKNRIELS